MNRVPRSEIVELLVRNKEHRNQILNRFEDQVLSILGQNFWLDPLKKNRFWKIVQNNKH